MSIKILPLSDALGAEISGFDWRQPPNEETREAINQAFFRHHLLCLRAEPLTSVQFANVARYFGEPQLQLLRYQRHNEAPEVSILNSTYNTPEDKPDDLKMMRLTGWHTDDSYFAVPAKATMYQSLEIPGTGGETGFCNTRKAYEDLPDEMKQKLDGLQAVHSYDTIRTPAIAPNRTREEQDETPDVIHPLIRTHDDTGIKAIYFNANRTDRIVGMEREESDKLLDWLHEHMTQQKYQYWHHWRVGDILLWDNRCLVHAVNMDFPVGERRVHQRILLKGSVPV
jgi:taurine dioxygenase